jgi:hypothetical protein
MYYPIFIRNPFDGFHSTRYEPLDPKGYVLTEEQYFQFWRGVNGMDEYLNHPQQIVFDENGVPHLFPRENNPDYVIFRAQEEFEQLVSKTTIYWWNKMSEEERESTVQRLDDLQRIIKGE